MSREFTPEDIREIGSQACPAIVASYEAIGPATRIAASSTEHVFGKHAIKEDWTELFNRFKWAVEQTPISVDAMGKSLVEAADLYDENEQDVAVNLNSLMSGLEDDFNDTRQEIAHEHEMNDARYQHRR